MAEFLHSADTANAGTYKGAFYAGNSVYFTGIRKSDGNIVAGRINESGTQVVVLQSSAISDIHSQPAIFADAQGYIYSCVVDTGEQEPTLYKSATPYGLDFAVLSVVTQPPGRVARYPQMFFDDAGTLWMFVNSSPENDTRDRDIQYTTSTDNGVTWSGWTTLWDAEDMRPYYSVQYVDGEILIVTTRTNPFDVANGLNPGYFLKYSAGAWKNSQDVAYTLPITAGVAEQCFDSATPSRNLGFGVEPQKDDLGRYFFVGPAYNGQSADHLFLCRVENGVWTQQDLQLGYATYFGTVISAQPSEYRFTAPIPVAGIRQIIEFESTDYGANWQSTQLTTGELSPGTDRERSSVKKIYGDNPKVYFLYADRRWNPTGGNFDWESDIYSLFSDTSGWALTYNLEWRDLATLTTAQVTGITDLSIPLMGLTASENYEFRVQETDGVNTSNFSGWFPFTTATAAEALAFAESALSTDFWSVVCSVSASFDSSAQATDAAGDELSAIASLDSAATGNFTVDALASAGAALTAGASAGEAWSAQAQVVMNLLSQGEASDSITRATENAINSAMQEGSEASDQFLGAITSIASISESASASDALLAVIASLASFSSGAIGADSFGLNLGQIKSVESGAITGAAWFLFASISASMSEVCSADALFRAHLEVTQSISATAYAADRFAIVNTGVRYLVLGAVTLRTALHFSVTFKP